MRSIDWPQRLVEATRQFDCIIVRAKMDKGRTRHLIDHVIVNRRDLDSVVAQGLDHWLHLVGKRDKIAGDRSLPVSRSAGN